MVTREEIISGLWFDRKYCLYAETADCGSVYTVSIQKSYFSIDIIL